jgi:Plasmid pRiA4b ORF-3-like protein
VEDSSGAGDVFGEVHAFTVADVRYSDPFFDLEETASEEAVRLRDAFPASARKPVRYEYDFGAGWVHEVTRTGASRRPGPFDMAKVNAALAG